MKLIVRTNSSKYSVDPEGFRNSDRCAHVVGAFCRAHLIPYKVTFVSIAVKVDKRSPLKSIGQLNTYGLDQEFGKYSIELDECVIKDIKIVAVGDFQSIICKAIGLQCSSATDDAWKDYLRKTLHDLRKMKSKEKQNKLEEIASNLPSNRYLEARIFRTLHTCDKRTV